MKSILLVTKNSLIAYIFKLVCKKINKNLTIAEELDTENSFELIILDDQLSAVNDLRIASLKNTVLWVITKNNHFDAEIFDFMLKKPFLPSHIENALANTAKEKSKDTDVKPNTEEVKLISSNDLLFQNARRALKLKEDSKLNKYAQEEMQINAFKQEKKIQAIKEQEVIKPAIKQKEKVQVKQDVKPKQKTKIYKIANEDLTETIDSSDEFVIKKTNINNGKNNVLDKDELIKIEKILASKDKKESEVQEKDKEEINSYTNVRLEQLIEDTMRKVQNLADAEATNFELNKLSKDELNPILKNIDTQIGQNISKAKNLKIEITTND